METTLPHLASLADIHHKSVELVDWAKNHPVEDYVYCLKVPLPEDFPQRYMDIRKLAGFRSEKMCIAGSSATHFIMSKLFSVENLKWKPTDVDLFLYGHDHNGRLSLGLVDLVQCKENSVEEILLNFDLPVCRAAINLSYDIYISAQCIAAIYSKKQNVPSYLRDEFTFNSLIKEHKTYDVDDIGEQVEAHLYKRFAERIKKYKDRGFGVNWIDTDEIIPWIKNRFHYGEWMN